MHSNEETAARLIAAREHGVKMNLLATKADVQWRKVYAISSNTPTAGCSKVPTLDSDECERINKALDELKNAI